MLTVDRVFDHNVIYTRAGVIIDILWIGFVANTKNKVFYFNMRYTKADVMTDILWVATREAVTQRGERDPPYSLNFKSDNSGVDWLLVLPSVAELHSLHVRGRRLQAISFLHVES